MDAGARSITTQESHQQTSTSQGMKVPRHGNPMFVDMMTRSAETACRWAYDKMFNALQTAVVGRSGEQTRA